MLSTPPTFTKQVYFGWIGNTDLNSIYRVTLFDNQSIQGGWGKADPYPLPEAFHTLPFCVVPVVIGEYNDLTVKGHVCNTFYGTISSYNTDGVAVSGSAADIVHLSSPGINLQNISQTFGGAVVNIQNFSTGTVEDYVHPSCMAADSARDFWITMPDSNIVAKIRDDDGTVMKIIQPFNSSSSDKAVNRLLTTQDNNNTYPVSGFMYEPSIVDTDTNNNIWVAFTQPLSSFIRKYDIDGNDLGSSYEFEFPQYVVPQDMVVDYDGNVWVATSNDLRIPETTINTS